MMTSFGWVKEISGLRERLALGQPVGVIGRKKWDGSMLRRRHTEPSPLLDQLPTHLMLHGLGSSHLLMSRVGLLA